MRMLCLERDNVTQLCDPDSDGDTYTASFEFFPFHEGATYSLFQGIYNGDGPYAGQFCVVRCLLDIEAEHAHWMDMISRAAEAQRLAHEFNKELAYPGIFFNVPAVTQMETVSDFNSLFRCFKPHDKRLKQGEYVTLEPYLEGSFRRFDQAIVAGHGDHPSISSFPHPGEPDVIEHVESLYRSYTTKCKHMQSSCGIAQAFSHFTWHMTGTHVVCGLQGVLTGLTYTLSNPQIHSIDARFGPSDGSTQAIAEFFRTHRCNNICRGWDRYSPDRNALPQINFLQMPVSDSVLNKSNRQNHQQQQQRKIKNVNQTSQTNDDINYLDSYSSTESDKTVPSAPALNYCLNDENPFSSNGS